MLRLNGGQSFGQSFALPVIQVDELVGRRDVSDNVKFADGFKLGYLKRGFRGLEMLTREGIFRPFAAAGQVFQRLVIFDEYVHELPA